MTTPTPDPEFVAMLEEFMDANDEALRRLAGIPQPLPRQPYCEITLEYESHAWGLAATAGDRCRCGKLVMTLAGDGS